MYRSAIALFCDPSILTTCMVIYQLVSGKYKLVERPGESYEGVGRKKNSGSNPCWSTQEAQVQPAEATGADKKRFFQLFFPSDAFVAFARS